MNQNYRSNNDSYKTNGKWIYIDGELYHWGIKGMKWGKHLPGTDWWKDTASSYGGGFVGNLKTAGDALKRYGKMVNLQRQSITDEAKTRGYQTGAKMAKGTGDKIAVAKGYAEGQIKALKNATKSAAASYLSNAAVNNWENMNSKTPISHLDAMANKQWRDATTTYKNSLTDGKFSNFLNTFIQTAQFNVVNGVNKFLKSIGLDDEVDSFLSKFMGESNFTKSNRLSKETQNLRWTKTEPTRTSGYNRAEAKSMGSGNSSTKHQSNTRGYERAEAVDSKSKWAVPRDPNANKKKRLKKGSISRSGLNRQFILK